MVFAFISTMDGPHYSFQFNLLQKLKFETFPKPADFAQCVSIIIGINYENDRFHFAKH